MRVAPATSVAPIVQAIFTLQRLQREMARLSPRDEDYESNRRALESAIRELRKIISCSVQ